MKKNNCHCCVYQICDDNPTPPLVTPNYLTSRVTNSQTIPPNTAIIFGTNSNTSGTNIIHTVDSSTFTLAAGQTYQVIFSVNGIDNSATQGMVFALKIDNLVTDTRIISQNVITPYHSGTAIGYVISPDKINREIQIVNLGLDTISLVNANISILQITNN